MGKQVVLGVVGVLVGIVAGMVIMMGLHMASTLVYSPPEGVSLMDMDPANQDKLKDWFRGLPAGAFVLAIVCHGLGCMSGAAVATIVSGRTSIIPALVIGAFFTVGGIMNLSSIPHPAWFPIADLPVYLVLAYVAGVVLKRTPDK